MPNGPSDFFITGPDIPLPPNGVGTYVGTFTFSGTLCGVVYGPHNCDVYLPSMTGTGTVFVTIVRNQTGQRFETSALYTF